MNAQFEMNQQRRSVFFDGQSLLHPPKVIKSFVQKITAGMHPRPERRVELRYPIAIVVDVQPLDEKFDPTGPVFQAVTRDISNSGIGITHNRLLESHFLAIQLWSPEGEKLQTLVEVLRSQPAGSIFDIGGRFVTSSDASRES